MKFTNKKVLITGAGRRLGLYLTEKVLCDGGAVYAVTREKTEELNKLCILYDKLEIIEIITYSFSPLTKDKISKIIGDNEIDLVINNASLYQDDLAINSGGYEQYIDFFNIHMAFPALIMEEYFNSNVRFGIRGVVINLTDIFSENPKFQSSLYCSTKAGLESLTKSLAKKYAPTLRVCSIQPGPIKFLPAHSASEKGNVLSQSLLQFESGFYPILQTIKFIFCNTYLTGCAIKVDGGRSINDW